MIPWQVVFQFHVFVGGIHSEGRHLLHGPCLDNILPCVAAMYLLWHLSLCSCMLALRIACGHYLVCNPMICILSCQHNQPSSNNHRCCLCWCCLLTLCVAALSLVPVTIVLQFVAWDLPQKRTECSMLVTCHRCRSYGWLNEERASDLIIHVKTKRLGEV